MTARVATNAAANASAHAARAAACGSCAGGPGRACSCLAAAVAILSEDDASEAERKNERHDGGKFLNHFSLLLKLTVLV